VSRIVRVGLVGLLGTLVLAACGDEGIGGAQRAFAEQADEVCLDVQEQVGRELGDDPAADRDAIRAATERFMQMNPPNEGRETFELFRRNLNNLWLNLQDIAQSQEPTVMDRAREQRARETMQTTHENVRRYAADYGMEQCARGFGRG
jgi:hypothetical protein